MAPIVRTATFVALIVAIAASGAVRAQPALPPDATPEGSSPILPPPPDTSTLAPPEGGAATEAGGHAKAVDELLGRLAATKDPETAKRIAGAVQALWLRSGSDTADLLTSRALEAQRKAKPDVALKLLDEVVGIKPDFAEAWNRRATLRFIEKDYDQAMVDIHETLVREPRHFGAWVGLGRILRETGLDKPALAAYRRALAVYPAIEGLKGEVDKLALEVEGRPI